MSGNFGKIIKLTFILFVICAIVAGVLGVVYNVTEPSITAQAEAKTAAAYAAVLTSSGFEPVEFDSASFSTVESILQSKDGNGWVVTSTFSGAQGMITMIVGVDTDYKCTGISITQHSETSGLGAIAASAGEDGISFRAQFVGKDNSVSIDSIDQIGGATITSRAVANAVANSINAVMTVK